MLKIFTKNVVGQIGNWLSPGGRYKKFISSNSDLIFTWNYENGMLSFKGKVGDSLKELFISMYSTKESKVTSRTSSDLFSLINDSTLPINQAVPDVSGLVIDSSTPSKLRAADRSLSMEERFCTFRENIESTVAAFKYQILERTEVIAKSKQELCKLASENLHLKSRLTELEAMVFPNDKLTISIDSTENTDINNTVADNPEFTARHKDIDDSSQSTTVPSIKTKCCGSCFDLREKHSEMSLVIEILKSQVDCLQAYVNSNKPSSPVNDFAVLIENLELQLVSLNDRNKRLEEEILAMKKYHLDHITKDNANNTKGIQLNPSGDINVVSDKTLLEENNLRTLSRNKLYANSANQTPFITTPLTFLNNKTNCVQQSPPPNHSRKSHLGGLPLIETQMDNISPVYNQLLKPSLYPDRNLNIIRRPFLKRQRKLHQNHRPALEVRMKDWSVHLDLVRHLLRNN